MRRKKQKKKKKQTGEGVSGERTGELRDTQGGQSGETGEVRDTQGGQSGATGEVQTEEGNETVGEQSVRWSEQVEEVVLEEEVVMEGVEAVVKSKLPVKRRRKTTSASSEAKASRVSEESVRKVCTDGSESDEGVSDESEVPNYSSSQQRKFYTAEEIKCFLKQTKNQQGVKVEEFFPNLVLFCSSVSFHNSRKEVSEITVQEGFRLKKLVLKVKKQLRLDDEVRSNVD